MKLLPLIIGIIMLCGIAQGTINISASEVSHNYIKWTWNSGLILTNMSIDGYHIILVDKSTTSFILSELQENTTHTIKIMTREDSGFNETSTILSDKTQLLDTTLAIILGYIFFIAAIICILIGKWVPLVAWLGVGLSCIGIVSMIGVSFWAGFVFMVIFCAGVIVAMSPE